MTPVRQALPPPPASPSRGSAGAVRGGTARKEGQMKEPVPEAAVSASPPPSDLRLRRSVPSRASGTAVMAGLLLNMAATLSEAPAGTGGGEVARTATTRRKPGYRGERPVRSRLDPGRGPSGRRASPVPTLLVRRNAGRPGAGARSLKSPARNRGPCRDRFRQPNRQGDAAS
jgi:hypothetical protein